MLKHNQDGSALPLVITIVLLIAAIGFGVWAFMGRQDYKNNTDSKIKVAVTAALTKEDKNKDNYYAEKAKFPLTVYSGPAEFGSLVLYYPKTWSAYVDDTGSGSSPVDGYFNPGHVPSLSAPTSSFALRVKVLNESYDQTIQGFTSQVKSGKLTSSAFTLAKLPNIVGVKLNGIINSQSKVVSTMVVLPLRSNTIELSTDGTQYLNDFNQNVLPYFSFSP